jgi:trimeric autotransporter adhesin
MSQINVDDILPQSGTVLTVNGIEIVNPLVNNTIIGDNAGQSIIGGINPLMGTMNTAVGVNAMQSSTIGQANTAVGHDAYKVGDGVNDTAIGRGALQAMSGTASYGNTAVGAASFFQLTVSTTGNSGLGLGAGEQLASGDHNTFIGYTSGAQFSSGIYNTTLGSRTTGIGTPVAGNYNVFLGTNACLNYGGGDSNIVIGAYNVAPPYTNLQTGANNIVIGRNATKASDSASDSITLGNSSHNVLRCAVTSITSLSDARDKKEVTELSAGLDFVNTLKPVEFVWDDRNENGKHDVKDFGFIAQDLKKSQEDAVLAETLNLVYEQNPERLEASYGKLVPILVKAIQDLSKEIETLKSK